MSLLLLEGFDDGFHSERWNDPFDTVGTSYGRHGNGGRLANAERAGLLSPIAGTAAHYFGFAVRPTTTTTGADGWLVIMDISHPYSGGHDFALRPNGANLEVWHSNALQTTVSTVFTAGEWSYIEVYLLKHASAGAVTVKQNGNTLYSVTSADTLYASGDMYFGFEGSANHLFDYDDFYIDDAGFKGDMRIDGLKPSGNGNSSQLTGSDADSTNNYLHVDEVTQDGDTSYVEHATVGTKDTYAYENHPLSTGTIHGITVSSYAKKTDTAARGFRRVVRSGTTDYTGSDISLGTGYSFHEEVLETDPNTAAAWTITNLNAAEFGFEVRP